MDNTAGIKQNVISGFFWKAMENGGDQLVTFVISVVLARILGPEKYGTMATMLIFIAIANVIIQNGFQTALIQKKEIDNIHISSVFWAGIGLSAAIYMVLFIAAPFIADFFEDDSIKPMIRVLSLILFTGAVTSVEIAAAARNMNFRIQCTSTVISDAVSGALGIFAAYNGMGTWALVIQQLVKNAVLAVLLFVRLKLKISFGISFSRLGELFGYGWKVLVSGLIDTVYSNIYTPFISKLYDAAMVGYYNRGNQFPQVIVNSMASTMQAVMLPAFSRIQDEKEKAAKMLRRAVKMSSFVMFPVLFGIAAAADPIVMILLGRDWMTAVPFLRLCCFSYSVWHIHVVNLQAINANGRSDIYLRLEIVKKIVGMAVLFLSIGLGVTGMILMKALFDYVCTFINGYPNKKIMGYGPIKQWKDIMPEFVLSAVMFVTVLFIEVAFTGSFFDPGAKAAALGGISAWLLLALQVGAGVAIYVGAAFIFRMESLRYLIETVRLILRREL